MDTFASQVDALLTPRDRVEDTFAKWRSELAGYAVHMKELRSQTPDAAMAWLASISARVLEMMLFTLEHDSRQATKFRVETLIAVRDECRFQFQVASRRQAVNQMDWEITRGYES